MLELSKMFHSIRLSNIYSLLFLVFLYVLYDVNPHNFQFADIFIMFLSTNVACIFLGSTNLERMVDRQQKNGLQSSGLSRSSSREKSGKTICTLMLGLLLLPVFF